MPVDRLIFAFSPLQHFPRAVATPRLALFVSGAGKDVDVVLSACSRYKPLLIRGREPRTGPASASASASATVETIGITVSTASDALGAATDYSYSIAIKSDQIEVSRLHTHTCLHARAQAHNVARCPHHLAQWGLQFVPHAPYLPIDFSDDSASTRRTVARRATGATGATGTARVSHSFACWRGAARGSVAVRGGLRARDARPADRG